MLLFKDLIGQFVAVDDDKLSAHIKWHVDVMV